METAISTGIITAGAAVIVALIKFVPQRQATNGNGYVKREVCEEKHNHLVDLLNRIERKLDGHVDRHDRAAK